MAKRGLRRKKIERQKPESVEPKVTTVEVLGLESNSEWPRKFRETFDLWQKLNPNLYNDLISIDQE